MLASKLAPLADREPLEVEVARKIKSTTPKRVLKKLVKHERKKYGKEDTPVLLDLLSPAKKKAKKRKPAIETDPYKLLSMRSLILSEMGPPIDLSDYVERDVLRKTLDEQRRQSDAELARYRKRIERTYDRDMSDAMKVGELRAASDLIGYKVYIKDDLPVVGHGIQGSYGTGVGGRGTSVKTSVNQYASNYVISDPYKKAKIYAFRDQDTAAKFVMAQQFRSVKGVTSTKAFNDKVPKHIKGEPYPLWSGDEEFVFVESPFQTRNVLQFDATVERVKKLYGDVGPKTKLAKRAATLVAEPTEDELVEDLLQYRGEPTASVQQIQLGGLDEPEEEHPYMLPDE